MPKFEAEDDNDQNSTVNRSDLTLAFTGKGLKGGFAPKLNGGQTVPLSIWGVSHPNRGPSG